MTNQYKRDSKGRFIKGTPQPNGFGKGKQKVPWNYHGGSIDQSTKYKRVYESKQRLYEHQLVWIQHFGEIPEGYVIHHIDRDKLNNSIENLVCISRSEHNHIHQQEKLVSCENIIENILSKSIEERELAMEML